MTTPFYATRNNVATTTTGYTAGSGSLALATGAGASFGSTFPLVVSTFTATGTPRGIYSCTGRTGDALTGLTLLSGTDASLPAGSPVEIRWTAEHAAQIAAAVNALEATVGGYGDIVTHDASEFALAGSGSGGTVPTDLADLTIADPAAERTRLGLGDAATHAASDFATASALAGYQPLDADLTAIAGLSSTGFAVRTGADTWAVRPLTASDIPTLDGSKITGTVPAATTAANLSGSITEGQVTGLAADLAAKAADSAVVHLTGAETITGTKTFSATIGGSITGNAATVTNGVYTTGSYGNPVWITSLDAGKLTGTIPVASMPVFGPSGGSHARGAVPDPGSVAGATRYLREDGTWATTSTPNFASGVGISAYPTPGSTSTTIEAGGGPIPQILNPLALVNLVSVTTQDSPNYVDLDLSSYVPPGAAVAWLYLAVQTGTADSTIKLQWRAKGDISTWGASGSDGSLLIQPMVVSCYAAIVAPVRLGPDRIVQYMRVNGNARSCIWRVWLMGWQ